jgi:hypothetical protein
MLNIDDPNPKRPAWRQTGLNYWDEGMKSVKKNQDVTEMQESREKVCKLIMQNITLLGLVKHELFVWVVLIFCWYEFFF